MSVQIFPGQGVKHSEFGFGVVQGSEVSGRVPVRWNVKTKKGQIPKAPASVTWILRGELEPATMSLEDREDMEKRIENYEESRGSRTLIPIGTSRDIERADGEWGPRLSLYVPSSDGTANGGKCEHGVYITPFAVGNDSRDCSLCHPYVIFVKAGAEYSA